MQGVERTVRTKRSKIQKEKRNDKMELSPVFLKQFKDTAERIFHVPGNYRGGILEMTVVLDGGLSKEEVCGLLPPLLKSLKLHSKVFQNVRFHFVSWKSEEELTDRVCPMMMAMTKGFYEGYECHKEKKRFELLAGYLKKFHARSKLIVVLTDGERYVEDEGALNRELQPFLGKKMMCVECGEEIRIRYKE